MSIYCTFPATIPVNISRPPWKILQYVNNRVIPGTVIHKPHGNTYRSKIPVNAFGHDLLSFRIPGIPPTVECYASGSLNYLNYANVKPGVV